MLSDSDTYLSLGKKKKLKLIKKWLIMKDIISITNKYTAVYK